MKPADLDLLTLEQIRNLSDKQLAEILAPLFPACRALAPEKSRHKMESKNLVNKNHQMMKQIEKLLAKK